MRRTKRIDSVSNTRPASYGIAHKADGENSEKTPRIPMLWTSVTPVTFDDILKRTECAIRRKERLVVGHLNLHGIYLVFEDRAMQKFFDSADYVYIDGMPLIWMGRLAGHHLRSDQRFTLLDQIETLLGRVSGLGGRIFYLGGKPGVADRAADILHSRIRNLDLDSHHGYFETTLGQIENNSILERINRYNPSLLLVGMGMPRQETWIMENLDQIAAPVIWSCGATFDYIAGEIAVPPRWTGPLRFEGLYRFLRDPRRLSRRYLYEPLIILKRSLQNRQSPKDRSDVGNSAPP
jgi:N-acetylglucosaminyldiphosphoundecaprenol N-acetyl-beta-D-mannosaminyltransferase